MLGSLRSVSCRGSFCANGAAVDSFAFSYCSPSLHVELKNDAVAMETPVECLCGRKSASLLKTDEWFVFDDGGSIDGITGLVSLIIGL